MCMLEVRIHCLLQHALLYCIWRLLSSNIRFNTPAPAPGCMAVKIKWLYPLMCVFLQIFVEIPIAVAGRGKALKFFTYQFRWAQSSEPLGTNLPRVKEGLSYTYPGLSTNNSEPQYQFFEGTQNELIFPPSAARAPAVFSYAVTPIHNLPSQLSKCRNHNTRGIGMGFGCHVLCYHALTSL